MKAETLSGLGLFCLIIEIAVLALKSAIYSNREQHNNSFLDGVENVVKGVKKYQLGIQLYIRNAIFLNTSLNLWWWNCTPDLLSPLYSNLGPLLFDADIIMLVYEICHIYLKWEPFCPDEIAHLSLYLPSVQIKSPIWLYIYHPFPFGAYLDCLVTPIPVSRPHTKWYEYKYIQIKIQTDRNNLSHADADDNYFLHEKITMLAVLMMIVRAKIMNAKIVMIIMWPIVSTRRNISG